MSECPDRIPHGVGERTYKRFRDQQMLVARDCVANAVSYEGKNGLLYTCCIDDKDYLLFSHDGQGFKDEQDLINGTKWCRSGGVELALWGQGLKFISSNCVRNLEDAELVIASICQDGKFRAVRAHADLTEGRWWITTVEPEWEQRIEKIVGKDLFRKYNVHYLFKCDPDHEDMEKGDHNFLNAKNVSAFWLSAPSFFKDFRLTCGGKQIGRSDYKAKKGETQAQVVERYSSIQKAIEEISGTGVASRPACSERMFHDCFMGKAYDIPCKPFAFQFDDDPPSYFQITKAHVVVELYPGHLIKNWLANIRSGTTDKGNPFKEGGQSTFERPSWTAVLYVPYCRRSPAEGEPPLAYARYADNGLYFAAAGDFMRTLGLPYINRFSKNGKAPFVLIRGYIEDVGNIVTGMRVEAATPTLFETRCKSKPDFTFDSQRSRTLLDAACEAARDNIPEQLIKDLEDMFPLQEADWLPIGPGGDVVPPPADPLQIALFDVDATVQAGEVTEFDGVFQLDDRKVFVLRDQKDKEFFSKVMKSSRTRGVDFKEVRNEDVSTLLGRKYADAVQVIAEAIEGEEHE
jgi:hypothetical protein